MSTCFNRRRSWPAALTFMAAVASAACGAGENSDNRAARSGSAEAAAVDFEAVAHTLVTRAAAVREGDIVMIQGGIRDLELLENLAVNVRSLGAFPIITMGSERLSRRMFDDVPERFDSQPSGWFAHLSQFVDVLIALEIAETPGLLAHVPQHRLATRFAANAEARATQARRRMRVVEVSNGLYPTPDRARRFNMSVDDLGRVFWEGVAADPDGLAATAERLKQILASASTVRVTHSNGTDLTLGIAGRRIFVSDGRVASEDEAPIGSPRFAWLPAGEVYLSPVPGTANGRVVVERHQHRGEEIRNLVLTFADGRLVEMEAESDMSAFRADFDEAPEGKDVLTAIDFGINPGVSGSGILAWVPAGMVTIAIGGDTWVGGDVDINYGPAFHLPGTTVTADDWVVVERGVLVGVQ